MRFLPARRFKPKQAHREDSEIPYLSVQLLNNSPEVDRASHYSAPAQHAPVKVRMVLRTIAGNQLVYFTKT